MYMLLLFDYWLIRCDIWSFILQKLRIDMRMTIPRVESRGKYEVIGNVLLLPVRSNGEFWAEFTDITAIAKVYGKEVKRENDTFMHIEKLGIDFTMKNARFKVKDNVNAGNVLGKWRTSMVQMHFRYDDFRN